MWPLYYHVDASGSVRAVTDSSGNVIERHDYLPFGEECTTGPCASNPGMGAGERRKFTGKERDPESGLDYFGARYYGSRIGRFTTVDPVYKWAENLVDPQRWNRYAYARNNPLRYVDPDGRETVLLQGRRTVDNVFGHVAIAINGRVFSYGSNYAKSGPGVRDWGVSQENFLAAQEDKRATNIMTLNVSEGQERTLLKNLQESNPNAPGSPGYSVPTNSCVTATERALDQSGVLSNRPGPVRMNQRGEMLQAAAPSSLTPGGLAGQVERAGLVKSTQQVGQEKSSLIRLLVGTVTGVSQ